jgi:hypothetical protein
VAPTTRSGSARAAGPFPSPLATAILAGMAGGFTPQGFIGRADELGRLEAALDRAEQGQPQLLLVAGDAGVGKTRLLLAFADQARRHGDRVLTGGCVELGDIGLAYLPVVDALRELADDPAEVELLAEVATTAPGIRRLLPGPTEPSATGVQGDGHPSSAVGEHAIAEIGPLSWGNSGRVLVRRVPTPAGPM